MAETDPTPLCIRILNHYLYGEIFFFNSKFLKSLRPCPLKLAPATLQPPLVPGPSLPAHLLNLPVPADGGAVCGPLGRFLCCLAGLPPLHLSPNLSPQESGLSGAPLSLGCIRLSCYSPVSLLRVWTNVGRAPFLACLQPPPSAQHCAWHTGSTPSVCGGMDELTGRRACPGNSEEGAVAMGFGRCPPGP